MYLQLVPYSCCIPKPSTFVFYLFSVVELRYILKVLRSSVLASGYPVVFV
jgi:hypothetical protein